jgi:hypothetical protein
MSIDRRLHPAQNRADREDARATESVIFPSTSQPREGGQPEKELTRDEPLDDITLYWLTNTGTSSARLYWENNANNFNAVDINIPAAITVFPGEIYRAPRSWAERSYHKLIYYHAVDKGGQLAAWEQPELFAEEPCECDQISARLGDQRVECLAIAINQSRNKVV